MFSAIMSFVFSGNIYGRSLYAITKCRGSILTAYEIQGEQIKYQTNTQIDIGAIGLALDPGSETLFATYDADYGGCKIVLINAKTMQQIKSIPPSYELAGIVYDQSRKTLKKPGNYNIITKVKNHSICEGGQL